MAQAEYIQIQGSGNFSLVLNVQNHHSEHTYSFVPPPFGVCDDGAEEGRDVHEESIELRGMNSQ